MKIKLSLPHRNMPNTIHPELATLVNKAPEGDNWLHEIKFDGYRILAFKQGKEVKLISRNQKDWTNKFPNIVAAIANLPIDNMILDGEIVVLDKKHHSNFQLLQNSIKENKGHSFIYYIFDLLYLHKYNVMSLPLMERKKILAKIIPSTSNTVLRRSDDIQGSGRKIFEKACALGLEGIVSKDSSKPYVQKRNTHWLKIKCSKRQEFVIAGFTAPQKSRAYFGSLLLGTFNKKGELIYHGNVGTGFTQTSLQSLYQLFKKNISSNMPFKQKPPNSNRVTWLKPVLVAEIEFMEWTKDNYLRHPSFKGLRSDKASKHVIKEKETRMKKIKLSSDIHISHPEKILYPEDHISKLDIAEYYHAIHDWILPYISNRPLTLVRCPNGYKSCFYQKHLGRGASDHLKEIKIKEKNGSGKYIYLENEAGLMALPQMGVLEIHPWGSSIPKIEYPDMMIFDLDPGPHLPWKKIVAAARLVKKHLAKLKLNSFVKTTGGKGLHVVVPIKPEYNWDQVKNFSHVFVDYLLMKHPEDFASKITKSHRKGKIYIDYLRNQRGATAVAPYSTRARLHAPVSTPLNWRELTDRYEDTFYTIKTLPDRLRRLKKDPWKDFFKIRQSLNLKKII